MINENLFYAEFGRRLRAARDERGLTQQAVAKSTKLSRASLANIERGRQRILLNTLVDLAMAVGVSPQGLLPDVATTEPVDVAELLKGRPRAERDWILRSLPKN